MSRNLLILLTCLLFAFPVFAQDAQDTPTFAQLTETFTDAVSTVVAPEATDEAAVPVSVDVTVNMPDAAPMPVAEDSLYELVLIIAAVIGTVVGIVGFMIGKANGTNKDTRTADEYAGERLELLRQNRAAMEAQERAYQNSSAAQKHAIDALAFGMRFVAPLTPWKTDDRAADYFDDIRNPGPPDASAQTVTVNNYDSATGSHPTAIPVPPVETDAERIARERQAEVTPHR